MKNNAKKVHERYHKNTTYSRKIIKENNFTYRLLLEILIPLIKGRQKRILDIGCGAGTISFYFANKGHEVFGIDISKKAIKECIRSAKEMGFKNTTFIETPFPEKFSMKKKFDIVILTEVIEHLENDNKAIKIINKILDENGTLVLSTPSINAPLHKLGLTKDFDKRVGHLRRYNFDSLKKLITSNGFKILKAKKSEGILRNYLFVNPYAGKLVRIINHFGSDLVTFLDDISLRLFGESNYIIVAKKVSGKTQ